MYLLELEFEGALANGAGRHTFLDAQGELPKWTVLPAGDPSDELLRLAALACGGAKACARLPCSLDPWCGAGAGPLRLSALLAPHQLSRRHKLLPGRVRTAIEISAGAKRHATVTQRRRTAPETGIPMRAPPLDCVGWEWFFVAHGPRPKARRGGDRFDFSDPFFRVTRFATLFHRGARLTDPVAFLARLHQKACQLSRYPAKQVLAGLAEGIGDFLALDTSEWTHKSASLARAWEELPEWQRRALVPILDAARHAVDASPFQPEPLSAPALFLFDRPEECCPRELFPRWAEVVDRLFPAAQLVVILGRDARSAFPASLGAKRLPLSAWDGGAPRHRTPKSRPGAILLVGVDGTLPNLALMKLSRYHKGQGREVVLARKGEKIRGVDAVFASCVFSGEVSRRRIEKLRRWYGEGLDLGGSGVDLQRRLPKAIEELPADLGLYPELGDRAIGFLTRGCPYDCPFCVVPVKEGPPRQVADLATLLQGRGKLILLDDNLLSHPKAHDFLEEMVRRDLQVNFTQTLDLSLVNPERARLLRRLKASNSRFTRRVYHFSLNDAERLDAVRQKYELFGFTSRDNAEFVCMYGYDTTLAEDVARFRFLRSLPGAYVFVQEYRPVPWEPAPEVDRFFGEDPDRLIRELVRICFPQNMKSMEKYYRWLSKRYARQFGRLNEDLVETIFKYNRRTEKGVYVATLAHTIPRREALGFGPR